LLITLMGMPFGFTNSDELRPLLTPPKKLAAVPLDPEFPVALPFPLGPWGEGYCILRPLLRLGIFAPANLLDLRGSPL